MLVTANDMNSLITDIWSALFGSAIMPAPVTPFDGRVIAATVNLRGDVDTTVLLRCDIALARRMAATMFRLDEDDLSSEDLQDTIGEIANIVAGNVKTLLGGDCRLTIPVVSDGLDPGVHREDRHIVQDDHFDSDGGHLAVTSTHHNT